jgi:methylthioribose-1-phosphate isomerase
MGMAGSGNSGLEREVGMLPTVAWENDRVVMIDQRKLPEQEVYVRCSDCNEVAEAIETMVIRGAPAIGVAAAYGIAVGIMRIQTRDRLEEKFGQMYRRLEETRPTAYNLFWALEQMKEIFDTHKSSSLSELKQVLLEKAKAIEAEDIEMCKKIGLWGRDLIQDGQTILTYCNAGALATAGYGTALGVVRAAHEEGKTIKVIACETRPFLQGARLTCWELKRDNIPVVLITDNMAGHFMQRGEISMVVTGADRIANNGDVANKIGTYSLAVLAKENGVPFYVAAPVNTIDFSIRNGQLIPIEDRDPDEVRKVGDCFIAPHDIEVRNPVFDVTPAKYISAIVTDKGMALSPYLESLIEFKR